jgi:hypothetical protein
MMMIGQGVLSTNITFRTKRPVANFAPSAILSRNLETGIKCASVMDATKGVFGYGLLKFNTHHINVFSNAWSTKCRLIACMST